MAAKGAIAKQWVTKEILEAFPGSFTYNDGKEIRINTTENGESIQIKVVLTAAKVAVEGGSDVALPGEIVNAATEVPGVQTSAATATPEEPSADEKKRLADLLERLGL